MFLDAWRRCVPASPAAASVAEPLRQLIVIAETDILRAERLMNRLMAADPPEFQKAAFEVLPELSDASQRAFLIQFLLAQRVLLDVAASPGLLSDDEAGSLVRALHRSDPLLDLKLMKLLPKDRQALSDQGEAVRARRILFLVSLVSDCSRILQTLSGLMTASDAGVRSKSTLLFARGCGTAIGSMAPFQDPDPRVRANAVEGLWRKEQRGARAMLDVCAQDLHHRVQVNALIGLHYLRDSEAKARLEELAVNGSVPFKKAAVWAMGFLGEESFLPFLERCIAERNPDMRGAMLRAIVQIRRRRQKPA